MTWTFDTDVTGWMTFNIPGAVEWDGLHGQPPGSLRLEQNVGALPNACYPTVDGVYLFRVDGYKVVSDEDFLCNINWAMYQSDDCSGGFASWLGFEPSTVVSTQNQWERLNHDLYNLDPADYGPDGFYKSIRPFLNKNFDVGEDDACLYDNVYLRITPTARVPTASPVGLAVLVVLLAAAAFVVLRKRAFAK